MYHINHLGYTLSRNLPQRVAVTAGVVIHNNTGRLFQAVSSQFSKHVAAWRRAIGFLLRHIFYIAGEKAITNPFWQPVFQYAYGCWGVPFFITGEGYDALDLCSLPRSN